MITGDEPINPGQIQGMDNEGYKCTTYFSGMTYRQWLAGIFMAKRLELFGTSKPLTEEAVEECAEEVLLAVNGLIEALNQPIDKQ